jgi:hypothetical protein
MVEPMKAQNGSESIGERSEKQRSMNLESQIHVALDKRLMRDAKDLPT